MAMDYPEDMLDENEQILLEMHQHRSVLDGKILQEILLAILIVPLILAGIVMASSSFIIFALLMMLMPVIRIRTHVIYWRNQVYIVTNHRVLQTSGLFKKQTVDFPLKKIIDVRLNQSRLAKRSGYGDIEILMANNKKGIHFRQIADPTEFRTAVLNAKERLSFDHQFGLEDKSKDDISSLIPKLDDFYKKGIISEEEYQQKKAKLLAI